MQWRDSPTRYGLVSRVIHWLMAAMLAWQLTGMALKLILGRHPLVATFVSVHQQVGLTLLVLVCLRILWALQNRRSRPGHAAGLMGLLAGLGQKALYLLMVVVPLLGLLRANTRVERPRPTAAGAAPAELSSAVPPVTPAEVDPLLSAIAAIHGPLAWTLLALILGHILMAVLHKALWRDGAADTMLGRIRG